MLFFEVLRFVGTSIFNSSFRYFAVKESDFKIASKFPSATTCPPKVPASGPISII